MTVPSWYSGGNAVFRSYENRASCSSGNVGGALAAGSAELFNEGRREGAVWIMVLLSDGGAGASNPITRINTEDIVAAQPYEPDGSGHIVPLPGTGGPVCTDPASPDYPCPNNTTGGYGAFGLCPYGTSAQPGELLTKRCIPNVQRY